MGCAVFSERWGSWLSAAPLIASREQKETSTYERVGPQKQQQGANELCRRRRTEQRNNGRNGK